MARLVKPALVASLQGGPMTGAIDPSPEQHEALEALVKALDDEAIDTLFGESDQIQIILRKPPPSEVWVRVDQQTKKESE